MKKYGLAKGLPEQIAEWAGMPDTACWSWDGRVNEDGYGVTSGRRHVLAHRATYEMLVGPIPEGAELDHLCRNRRCFNPKHLEPVTHRVNVLRGDGPCARFARRTHCKRGHPLGGDNQMPNAGGHRICLACKRIARANWHRRQKAESAHS